MQNRHPQILVVYPSCNIDVNPTIAYFLETLAARGVATDVLLEDPGEFSRPADYGPGVRTLYRPTGQVSLPGVSLRGIPRRLAQRFANPALYRSYRPARDLSLWPYWNAGRYSAIVGVDPVGIATADRLNRRAGRPLVYLSFELLFEEEIVSSDERALRAAEREACRRTDLVLIQDEERAAELTRELAIPQDRISLVPVAPPPRPPHRSDYLRRRFDIAPDRRIVLYFGSVEPWTCRDELPEMVAEWPERFTLVIHSSSRIHARMSPQMRDLVRRGRILLSTEPVGRQELPEMVASADYGLAPYRAVADSWVSGRNVHHMGLASGKVAFYAMSGLPILARSLPVYEREFPRYYCGRTYRRWPETGAVLEEMERDYARYREGALRFYAERLCPVQPMERFVERLLALAESPSRQWSPARAPFVPFPVRLPARRRS